jgi:hypothetical protein
MLRPGGRLAAILLVAAMSWGCAPEVTDAFGPENDLEVTNQPDMFQITAVDLKTLVVTQVYQWTNAGTSALVEHRSFVPHGDSKLEIRDAAGTTVYSRPFLYELDGTTATGVPGTWTITVALYGVVGRIDVTIRRTP